MTANWTSWCGSSRSDRRTLKAFWDFVYCKKRAAAILSSGSGDFSTRARSGIETLGSRLDTASTRFDFGNADVCTDWSNRSCSANGKTLRSRQCKRYVTIDILSVGSDLTFGRLRTSLRKGAAAESWSQSSPNKADLFSSSVEFVHSNSKSLCNTFPYESSPRCTRQPEPQDCDAAAMDGR